MPKIIENLEEEIARSSLKLFKENPYQNVSMRRIASEAGIAVGTLYNYYPNKWELYIGVFEESWKETYQILSANCKNTDNDYLKNYIEVLYSEMKEKKSIVRELFRYIMNDLEIGEEEQKEKFKRIRFPNVVINQIYELFIIILEKEFKVKLEKDDEDLYRLFAMLQTNIPLLQQNFKKEKQNIDFLYDLICSFVEKKIV
ncbi:TetR/AcrR family transcriptional regulator [Halanaerobium kushneri]|jgi:AcrR family transcriptional regulator|uniref:Transcriptional regulator, TetR family n=1 Tax=Halanaerobium kushneri TaxID=56779 RepID=A0A1N6PBP2_9FIRM|nr:TetR/AcrR family transcriptional regulator [Halanaerobium kushneri]SIQ01734.1 transcriptional regulator, TetR family [Halanaerobium kushneri]